MKFSKQLVALSLIATIAAACTASVRVMPGPGHVNRVVARDIEKHGAEKAAHKAAVAFCHDHGMETVFLTEHVWYEGIMDEATRTAIRRQSAAATVFGGYVSTADDSDAGLILQGAGVAGSTYTSGKDYTAEISFTCRMI